MKVLIVNGSASYINMFLKRGFKCNTEINISSVREADLIQFTGGEDVTPEIYGEENTRSHNNQTRDLFEAGVFALALRMGKPMAGICRGGQFLNTMCGGSMIQHIEGHAIHGTHEVETINYGTINVTSTHHQLMMPNANLFTQVLAWAGHRGKKDNEVIYYPYHRALCFQPHPEFEGFKDCTDYYFDLLASKLGM